MLSVIGSILSFFPVIGLAALGGLVTQKSGVWNIALEGMMTFGAFSGVFAYYYLNQSILTSLFFGFLIGLLLGTLLSGLCVYRGLNQIVVGFGLWFITEGLAGFLYNITLPSVRVTKELGPRILSLDPVFYLTIISFALFHIILRDTKLGLAIIATGENPKAADTAGIDVYKIRWMCTSVGSGLICLAGAYLSLVILQGFTYKIVAGYGWISFALILFGRWSAGGIFSGSLLFTFLIGIQTRLQVARIAFMPSEFMIVLPHIGVIFVLTLTGIIGKKSGMPTALGVHYDRE